MTEGRIPLNGARLAAIHETAELWSKDRCDGLYHEPTCICAKRG